MRFWRRQRALRLGIASFLAAGGLFLSPVTSSKASAEELPPINCVISTQNPHESSHLLGTVNVVGSVSCNLPVAGIGLTVALYDSGVLVSTSSGGTGPTTYYSLNASTSTCVPGIYQGMTTANIVPPPGYAVFYTSGTNTAYSSYTVLDCLGLS